jgi:hypothetical protein
MDNFSNKSARNTIITRKKQILLEKSFTAGAAIPPFTKMQESISGERKILDGLNTIIVNAVCKSSTGRTDMLLSGQFDMDVKLIGNILCFCDDYVFQIEQF